MSIKFHHTEITLLPLQNYTVPATFFSLKMFTTATKYKKNQSQTKCIRYIQMLVGIAHYTVLADIYQAGKSENSEDF